MGSVAVSEVVSDSGHFPFNMLAGHAAHQPPPADPTTYRGASTHPTTSPPLAQRRTKSVPLSSGTPQTSLTATSESAQPQAQAPFAPPPPPTAPTAADLAGSQSEQTAPPSAPEATTSPTQPPPAPPPEPANLPRDTAQTTNDVPEPAAIPPSSPSANSTGLAPQPTPNTPPCIHVRNLSHIQKLASEDFIQSHADSPLRSRHGADQVGLKYEISAMPVMDIIEMVAGLLTKITTTNDIQHETLHRHILPMEGAAGMSPQSTSVLAFHGKNVPSITILSYLSRIQKYCPSTYEVFLSLLVYFDRMTERVNSGPMRNLRRASGKHASQNPPPQSTSQSQSTSSRRSSTNFATSSSPPSAASPKIPPSPSIHSSHPPVQQHPSTSSPSSPTSSSSSSLHDADSYNASNFFVVDSFNIHRLVIAGVTCASKFFSDVFYTNSRYAKVGGLPLTELNHLEIQFLLLNDFRLSVPVEELEAYGTMLVEFYAREVIAQSRPASVDVVMGGTEEAADSGGGGGRGNTAGPTDERRGSNVQTPMPA